MNRKLLFILIFDIKYGIVPLVCILGTFVFSLYVLSAVIVEHVHKCLSLDNNYALNTLFTHSNDINKGINSLFKGNEQEQRLHL